MNAIPLPSETLVVDISHLCLKYPGIRVRTICGKSFIAKPLGSAINLEAVERFFRRLSSRTPAERTQHILQVMKVARNARKKRDILQREEFGPIACACGNRISEERARISLKGGQIPLCLECGEDEAAAKREKLAERNRTANNIC